MIAYGPNTTARCPHCLTTVRFEYAKMEAGSNYIGDVGSVYLDAPSQQDKSTEKLILTASACPECGKLVLTIANRQHDGMGLTIAQGLFIAWPRQKARPVPEEVPDHIAADYNEAALVLSLSPKASAALSRRCLQAVLREAGDAHQYNLSDQIDAVMPTLPSYIGESIDAIRKIGNFAAHPMKDKASGQIVEVEPGEAEWTLDVLDTPISLSPSWRARIGKYSLTQNVGQRRQSLGFCGDFDAQYQPVEPGDRQPAFV